MMPARRVTLNEYLLLLAMITTTIARVRITRCAMTNYEKLFGTPERAARTLIDSCNDDYDYGCGGCPVARINCKCGDYDALLEWLESDVCDD